MAFGGGSATPKEQNGGGRPLPFGLRVGLAHEGGSVTLQAKKKEKKCLKFDPYGWFDHPHDRLVWGGFRPIWGGSRLLRVLSDPHFTLWG
jgi:hypothetical protein